MMPEAVMMPEVFLCQGHFENRSVYETYCADETDVIGEIKE